MKFSEMALFWFFSHTHEACRLLVPRPEIKPVPPAELACNPNPWATREFPKIARFNI